jgi:hypothetical protein
MFGFQTFKKVFECLDFCDCGRGLMSCQCRSYVCVAGRGALRAAGRAGAVRLRSGGRAVGVRLVGQASEAVNYGRAWRNVTRLECVIKFDVGMAIST